MATPDEQNAAVRALGEVMVADAEGEVAEIYEDVQRRLGVPFVNFVFRVMATRPAYLSAAWQELSPALSTESFERGADELREMAEDWARAQHPRIARWTEQPRGDELRRFSETIRYVLPKLLLVATAAEQGRVRARSLAILQLEPLDGALALEMIDPADAEGPVADAFARMPDERDHPGVASYYRAIAIEPAFFEAAWSLVDARFETPAYAAARAALRKEALARVDTLFEPALVELPHEDEVRLALGAFKDRLIPDLLLDVSLICRGAM